VWYTRGVGFFDFRCPITRLSLRGMDAVHIALVAVTPERWAPLTLPIRGNYDRLGSIDFIKPDGVTARFVDGFMRMIKAGRVRAPGASRELDAVLRAPGLEALLKLFARANTDSIGSVSTFTLDGRALRQMLIHAGAFEALAPDVPTRAPGYEALEQQLLRAPIDPLAREMFEEVIIGDDDLRLRASVALTRIAALDAWLAAGDRSWAPGDEAHQSDHVLDHEYALAARRDLAAHPALVRVIDGVLAELELEAEEDRRHQAWLDRIRGRS
jgi:hypothetical protein